MLRGVAALVVVLLVALATAYADGAGGGRTNVEGQLDDYASPLVKFANGDVYTLTSDADKKLKNHIDSDVVHKGDWLRLFLDPRGYAWDFQKIDDPVTRPQLPRLVPGKAKFEELALSLKPGDIVLVNGNQKYAFNFYRNGQLVLDVLPLTGKRAQSILSLSKLTSLDKLEGAEATEPGERPVAKPNLLMPKPGEWVELDGVKGSVLYVTDEKIALSTSDGLREFPRVGIVNIQKIDLPITPGPKPETPLPGNEGDRVTIEQGEGKLDYIANTHTFHGTVSHRIAGKILIGARLELEARGDGQLLLPDQERKMVRALGSELRQGVSGVTTFEGIPYYVLWDPASTELVIAMISDVPQRDSLALGPIFPGVPEPYDWPCRMLNPKDVHYRLVYDQKNAVASSDKRAQGAIIRAYEGDLSKPGSAAGDQAHREAALSAIATSGQPAFLPFLLYQLYIEQGSGEPIRRAFAAYGKTGEDWLLQFFKDKATDAALAELAVPTAGDHVEKKRIGEPPRLVARAIELLSTVITDRSSDRAFGLALPYARDRNEELRAAARALFIDHTERSVPFMLRRLRSEPEVVSLLLEIDERRPGTLEDLVSRHCNPDAGFLQSLAGLEPPEKRRKLVECLRRELSDKMEDSDIVQARESIARIKALIVELGAIRADVSKAYDLRARDTSDRFKKSELLRRAVLLDPKEELPRHELARILEETARETMQGANVRAGPGVTYPQLRSLQAGDVLGRAPDTDATRAAAPEWLAVRATDSRVGYVPPDLVRDQGRVLLVDKTARPRSVPRWLLLKARDLDPGAAHDIDRSIAEVNALEADEAAHAGDWDRAAKLYQDAFGRAPERYRLAALGAYLRASPLVLGLAAIFAVLFIVALVGTNKPARQASAVVLARKEKAVAGAGEAKKVPS